MALGLNLWVMLEMLLHAWISKLKELQTSAVTCLTPAVPRSSYTVTTLGSGVLKRHIRKRETDRKISVNYKLELPIQKKKKKPQQ